MAKIDKENKIIDLLEKNLIIQLYVNGATRDQIAKMLKVGAVKVTNVIKFLKKDKKNG